jgi:ABC-2 type transport system permease protein
MITMYLNELHRLLTKSTYVLMMVVLPFVMFFVFAGVYTRGSLRDLPVMVVDYDHTALSRTLIRSFDGAQGLKVTDILDAMPDVKQELLSRRVHAVIVIPENLQGDVKRGKQTTVTVYKASNNLIISNVVLNDVSTVIKTVSAGALWQKLQVKGVPKEMGLNIVSSLNLRTSPMFNPYYNYAEFMVPPLCLATLQMIVLIAAVLSAYDSFENDGLEHPEEFDKRHVVKSVLGKYFAHMSIYAVILPALYLFFRYGFGLILHQAWTTYAMMLLFVSGIYFIGALVGLWVKNRFFGVEIAVFLTTPGFVFAGYSFPISAMPGILAVAAKVFPMTIYFAAFIKTAYMDAPYIAYKSELITLTLIAAISLVLYMLSLFVFIKKQRSANVNAA